MKFTFLIDRDIREHIKKHGNGSVSAFTYYALKHYLSYLERADIQTLLEEITRTNKISIRKHGSITLHCRITTEQYKRLTIWGKYAKLSKLMNRALQFYIERVYNTRLDLETIKYRNGKNFTMEAGEENIEKINKLRYSGELERAVKSYVEHFESLDVIGKLCEIAKINTTTTTGKKKKLELYNVDISPLKRLCERYGLKIKYVLIRAVEWYTGR